MAIMRSALLLWISLFPILGCAGELDDLFRPDDRTNQGDAGGGGQEPLRVYRPNIQADLNKVGCLEAATCHGAVGVSMSIISNPSTDPEWLANYDEVKLRGGSGQLLALPTGVSEHKVVLETGAPTLVAWRRWIDAGMPYE